MSWPDIIPPLTIGATFTTLGVAKLIGLYAGIVGGRDVGFTRKLCGT